MVKRLKDYERQASSIYMVKINVLNIGNYCLIKFNKYMKPTLYYRYKLMSDFLYEGRFNKWIMKIENCLFRNGD